MNGTDLVLLVVILVLVLVAGVLAVAETAVTRMTRSRAAALAEPDRKRGRRVQRIVDNLERDLNAVYLAVNIVQTVQAALVGVLAGRLNRPAVSSAAPSRHRGISRKRASRSMDGGFRNKRRAQHRAMTGT